MRSIATSSSSFPPVAAFCPQAADLIEWEELPSLADSLQERLVVLGTRHRDAAAAAKARASMFERVASTGKAWAPTMPAELSPMAPSEPFAEPLNGLAVREVHEPDLFRHFFGRPRLG